MSFQAQVYRVLIASPSDLLEERQIVSEVVHDWNAQHAHVESIVLLPVRWETHAVPRTGIKPQEAINQQLVATSDILVGLFWTRLGTSTGVAESGTVEEIEKFIADEKPAMLYFSNRPIDPNRINIRQHKKLRRFQGEACKKALIGNFHDLNELRAILLRDLIRLVRDLRLKSKPKPEGEDDSKVVALQRQVEELALRFHRMQSQLSMQTQLKSASANGDINAERAILGAILLDNAVVSSPELQSLEPADFSMYSHEIIYSRMMELAHLGEPIDFITLVEMLDQYKELDSVGGVAYVTSLTDGLPRIRDLATYVRRVKSFRG